MSALLKQIKAAASRETAVEYLALVEKTTAELAGQAPKSYSEDYNAMVKALAELSRFAWALAKFPVFDSSVLDQKHVAPCSTRHPGSGQMVTLNLNVPVFCRAEWSKGSQVQRRDYYPSGSEENASLMQQLGADPRQGFNMRLQLEAKCPAPPKAIRELVASVEPRFDRVDIAWEAEWKAEVQVRDPLVIGIIGRTEFLIAEYDASKLEKYIASEFTRSVPK